MKKIHRILFTVASFLLFLLQGCRDEAVRQVQEDPVSVKIAVAISESVSIPAHTTGILLSSEELKLSFKTGGIVADVQVREGERIRKGDVMAMLNMSEINAQVNVASNGYEKALRDYNRATNLYRDTVATLEQLENATTAMNVARSNLEIARFNLAHSSITAPADGIVLKQFVRTNELVAPGYPVFLFGTSGKSWKVRAGVSDRDIVRINSGDSAAVTFNAWPGVRFPATVEQVGELADQLTGTYEVELALDDLGYRLATGFVAGADIYPAAKDILMLVPVESVIEADGQTGYLFALSADSTVTRIKAEILTILGSKAVISNLPASLSHVVTEGAAYIKDGDKVKVVK